VSMPATSSTISARPLRISALSAMGVLLRWWGVELRDR
jgi:hypothetical protein